MRAARATEVKEGRRPARERLVLDRSEHAGTLGWVNSGQIRCLTCNTVSTAINRAGRQGHPAADRLQILHDAVLKACDALDGQSDGLVSTPSLCRFDPGTIPCSAGQDEKTCLTAAEVGVARAFYEGPHDPQTGERLTVGGPQFGSELAWAGVYVPYAADQPVMSRIIALQAMRSLIFETDPPPGYTLADLHFDRATFDRLRARHELFDATNPDLSAFAARGGKLILWHGWADPRISPLNTIAYHQAVHALLGEARTEGFERLYLLPGVYHCSGGDGPSLIDLVTPMMNWVEQGQAPDGIVTTQASSGQQNGFGQPGAGPSGSAAGAPAGMRPHGTGLLPGTDMRAASSAAPDRSRPVYPYPYIDAYDGKGDPNQASNYHRSTPLAAVQVPKWAGSDFYRPYAPQQR